MDDQAAVLHFLNSADISYSLLLHPTVQSMEDCAAIARPYRALYPKNLFLTTRTEQTYSLLLLRPFLRYQASVVSKQAQSARLQFAHDEALFSHLRAKPGFASPLSLFMPCAKEVQLLVDAELLNSSSLCFHPLSADATVVLSTNDFFQRFLPLTGHTPRFLTL